MRRNPTTDAPATRRRFTEPRISTVDEAHDLGTDFVRGYVMDRLSPLPLTPHARLSLAVAISAHAMLALIPTIARRVTMTRLLDESRACVSRSCAVLLDGTSR